ncbi:golgin subfamily A member 2 [Nilaparvata lugens]|uniref:golgin subfamily A member 2 n=1 Tax=Nilaparvata lugens TaxID=108931 RepID=UPI000B98E814|nr:golgin subfamily A member 2 [Nilaparvata lugens]
MSDKNKLAAGRRMLEEYKKKHRNNNVTSTTSNKIGNDGSLPSGNSYFAPPNVGSNIEPSSTPLSLYNPFKENENAYSAQNYDNVNLGSHMQTVAFSDSTKPNQSEVAMIGDSAQNGNLFKSDDHYVAQLVSELKTQQVPSNDNALQMVQEPIQMKSAKDFFDNLPGLENANTEFALIGQQPLFSNVAGAGSSTVQLQSNDYVSPAHSHPHPHPQPSPAVPLFSEMTEKYDFNAKRDYHDERSDRSESVPVTPSDQDRSEDSSSSDHTSKQVHSVLEQQLRELDIRLGAQIENNKQLQDDLQKSENTIAGLEQTVETVRREKEAQEKALEEKLKYHVTTLEILIAEKTELQTALTTCQESISQKAGEMEELQGRLRASRHRVGDLERKLALSEALQQQHEKSAHEATIVSDTLKQEVNIMRKRLEETDEEVLSLKHKVEVKTKDIDCLQNELREKNSQLSVSEVRIQQLSDPNSVADRSSHDESIKWQEERNSLQMQIAQLNADLKKLSTEKDDASLQYQQYVASLNLQMQSLTSELQTISNQNESLSAREASLVEHVSNLEKQLQQTQQRKLSPPLRTNNGELEKANKQVLEITAEKHALSERLEKEVADKNQIFEALQIRNERIEELERSLERLESDRPDVSRLQAAIESDKVAASRAVAQNSDLKKQLEELQDAFIKLSNNKLELTELLEKEQHINKELKEQLSLIGDSKPIEAHSHHHGEDHCDHSHTKPNMSDFCSQTYNIKESADPGIVIDFEAMAKLEEKFKRKMQEVADLSDEKQRLEHLVMQLQGETETIGEYIALYQIQRGMLRQRAQEKDEQMARLAHEKELMRNKLKKLNNLIKKMVSNAQISNRHHFMKDPQSADSSEETATELNDSSTTERLANGENENEEETVVKIEALLSEIGSSSLVTSDHGDHAVFHSCPLCSDRPLITV